MLTLKERSTPGALVITTVTLTNYTMGFVTLTIVEGEAILRIKNTCIILAELLWIIELNLVLV